MESTSPCGLLEMLDVVLLKSMESPHSPHGLHGDSWRVPMESSWSLWERVGKCKVLGLSYGAISITLCPPEDRHPCPDGFVHSAPCRVEDSLQSLGYFPQKVHPPSLPLPNNDIHSHQNGLSCPAWSCDGCDVII